jgi:hypothetical protein
MKNDKRMSDRSRDAKRAPSGVKSKSETLARKRARQAKRAIRSMPLDAR